MKKTLILIGTVILALLCNIQWEWHPNSNLTYTLTGPQGGIALCVLLSTILIYKIFLAFQDFLVSKRYIITRVRSNVDALPLLILLPLVFDYTDRGSTWFFKWGIKDWTVWYFISILGTVFIYQIYLVVRAATEVANNQK